VPSPGSNPGNNDDPAADDRTIDELVAQAARLVRRLDLTVAGMERKLNQGRQGT
jgi:hypothetical protein